MDWIILRMCGNQLVIEVGGLKIMETGMGKVVKGIIYCDLSK